MYVSCGRIAKTRKYKIELAEDIFGKRRYYKKNANPYSPQNIQEYFELPACDGFEKRLLDMNAWLILFGIWLAEGWVARNWEHDIINIAAHKQRVKDELIRVCDIMKFDIKKIKGNKDDDIAHYWRIHDQQLSLYMKQFSVGAIHKSLPDWCWNLSGDQARILLEGMLLGDGHTMDNGTRRYDTSSIDLANDVQRLCLHIGWSTNLKIKYKAGHTAVGKTKTITSTVDAYGLTIITSQNEPEVNNKVSLDVSKSKPQDKYIPYDGKVYCCTVSSGVIYVRRNGIPIWCGNSVHGQKSTIGIILNQSDMPFSPETGIIPDIIINPNCINRMTIGQLIECIVGKASALQGCEGDGTSFNGVNIEQVKDKLEEHGFNRDCTEYLYNGMTGQKLQVSIFIGPTYYQRLKHLVMDKMHCLTLDHEVLTDSGWKFYNQLSKDDNIAILKNNELIYEKPLDILYYENINDQLFCIDTPMVDLQVTLNHRLWASNDNTNFSFVYPKDIIENISRYKKNANFNMKPYNFVLAPNYQINMDAWLKLFGIIIYNDFNISHILINNNISHFIIINLLSTLNFSFSINDNILSIINDDVLNYILSLHKLLPSWIWLLSQKQCKLLLNSLFFNDQKFFSLSVPLLDDIMRLCLHAGWSGNIFKSNGDFWGINIIKSTQKNKPLSFNSKIINYNGPVFCLSVSSGVFYVRRNGKGVWTGNSRSRGQRTLLTRQPPEGRSRDGGLRFGEMERDSLLSHGMAKFLKERLVDCSDITSIYVCDICGLFAQRMRDKVNNYQICKNDIYFCPACNNKTRVSRVNMPYAFKLLIQELMAINIAPRIRTKHNIFNE